MYPDVLIVGAGPVGLFTAIETKLLNPKLHIKILERNNEYTRHHILRLEEQSLINSESYKKYSAVRSLKGFVPTSEIESTLVKIATELGIDIERGAKISDAQKLFEDYPDTQTIIGADGAHSTIREQLFNDAKIVDKNLQYIVEIKYHAKGQTKRLPTATYGLALGQVNHLVSENVGREKDGNTPVSLFIFVDEATYEQIRLHPNTQIKDLKPNNKRMELLINTIQPWLALRKEALKESMILNSEKINGVALNVYQSECFAQEIKGKNVYLVGDAAAAVPYFRALNAGLISAQETAKTIAGANPPDLKQLNTTLAQLATGEIKRANKNNKQVNLGRGLNTFLSFGSKLTTGSLLGERAEEAMLNARVKRPNIFRRNPRFTMALIIFALVSGILIGVLNPAFPVIGLTLLFSFSVASIFVGGSLSILKLKDSIMEMLNPPDPINPLPAFPWEKQDMPEEMSNKKLSKLSVKKDGRKQSGPIRPGPGSIRTTNLPLLPPVTPEPVISSENVFRA